MPARPAFKLALIVLVAHAVAFLLAVNAHAEVLHNGKVHQTTADKVIAERQLVCTYGKTRFEDLPDGRTVIVMGKVCVEVSR